MAAAEVRLRDQGQVAVGKPQCFHDQLAVLRNIGGHGLAGLVHLDDLHAGGDDGVAVGQPLGHQGAGDFLLPDDFVFAIALGDAVAVVLGHQHAVAGQRLGVERLLQTVDRPADAVRAIEVHDFVGVEQHHQREPQRLGGPFEAGGIDVLGIVLPPGGPDVAELAAGGLVGAEGGGRRLVLGQPVQQVFDRPRVLGRHLAE